MSSDDSPSVGTMLQTARRQQGFSVEDVADRTWIRSSLVRQIEGDDFSGCGHTFHARGHVRSIAVVLGLDPAPVLAEFDDKHGPSSPDPVTQPLRVLQPVMSQTPPQAQPSPLTGTRDTAATTTKADPPRVSARQPSRPARSASVWLSATVVVGTVVALLAVAIFLIGDAREPRRPPTAAPHPSSPSAQPSPSASSASAEPGGVTVQIRATSGSTWIRVTDGSGAAVFEGVLNTGDVKDFSDPKMLTVRYGNSSAVSIVVNGQDKGSPTCGVCSETYDLADGTR